MTAQKEAWLRTGFGVLAGLLGTVVLASLWHLFGGAAPPKEADYVYTQYFTSCLGWVFAAVYLALSIVLGWILRRVGAVALGMMLPLPIAFGIEVSLDQTSHNLIPFEMLLVWLPAFSLALLGAYLGKTMAVRVEKKKSPIGSVLLVLCSLFIFYAILSMLRQLL